eukprot:gene9043-6495_t
MSVAKRARTVANHDRSMATPYTNAKTDSEQTSSTKCALPKGVSPPDLSYISSSSEESVVETSFVMEGAVASTLPSADTAAGPCHSSNVEEDMGYREVSSLEEAREWLEERHPRSSLAVLAGTYSPKAYDRLLQRGEGKRGKWCHHRLVNGQVQLFELPTKMHEVAASQILLQLRDQNRYVQSEGSGDIFINATTKLEPDESIFIDGDDVPRPGAVDPNGGQLPKIVVEVSYSEPYNSIGALPARYFSVGGENGIQAVILIFIHHPVQPVEGRCQMVVLLYDYRIHQVVCDQEGLAAFQLPVDGELLWKGYDAAARAHLAATNAPFVVDLYKIKRLVKRGIIAAHL